ncbi:hypothetical protein D3C87_1684220 [compost metagenome]
MLRGKAADGEHVAPSQVAFTRTEGDAGHIAQHVLQALGLLFFEHGAWNDSNALRRIQQGFGEFAGLHAIGLVGRGVGLHRDGRQQDGAVRGRGLAVGLSGGCGAERHAHCSQGERALSVCFLVCHGDLECINENRSGF